MESLQALAGAGAANLLAPAVLFFALGALAGWLKSDLTIPDQVAKTLALYLMLCIGFKGGAEAAASGLSQDLIAAGGLGLGLSFATPFAAYIVLKAFGVLDRLTAAATAAHYGSVSVVTFAAGTEYLRAVEVEFGGYMAAVLALMETPAILAALIIAGARSQKAETRLRPTLWREVFLNGAAVVLIGSFVIGAITGERGMARLDVFVGPLFQGALCLFLLDMGLVASRRLAEAPRLDWRLIAFAIAWPLLSAAAALGASAALGLSLGDATLMAVLAASASYIAAPAAMRIALPKADAGIYLSLSLGVTFPFNLLIGIPLYHAAGRLVFGG
ncbi:MAG: sodium-dependent bicarbonate transport family permease [Hyphomonadaceae bacterium]|nr:sodium-dependent bicarbonate transport family permease [Hyphomonadaceae bacterium]